jgi:phosphomevalonate kinase
VSDTPKGPLPPHRASAPGKLVVMGEYAVLFGHPAVVTAVDVRATATAWRSPPAPGLDRRAFADNALLAACLAALPAVATAPVVTRLQIDTGAFAGRDRQKYGLGSSAAGVVAALRVLLPDADTATLHAEAQRAHRRFQKGLGSGIDVAASVYGGLVRFARHSEQDDDVSAAPLPGRLSELGLALLPVWTGQSQDTRPFVASVMNQKEQAAGAIQDMANATASFLDALEAKDAGEAMAAFAAGQAAMAALGSACDLDIVSAPHARVQALAGEVGGVAKPSGAGGGDIALCLVPSSQQGRLTRLLAAAGFAALPLPLQAPGAVLHDDDDDDDDHVR